jgi:hypothetical protein
VGWHGTCGGGSIYALTPDAELADVLMSSTVTHTFTWLGNADDALHEQTIYDFARYAQGVLGAPPALFRVRAAPEAEWPPSPNIGSNWQAFAVQQGAAATAVLWRALEVDDQGSTRRYRELYAVPARSPAVDGPQPFPPAPVGTGTSLDYVPVGGTLGELPRWDLAWDYLNPDPEVRRLTWPRAASGTYSRLIIVDDPFYFDFGVNETAWNGFPFDRFPAISFAELRLTNLGAGVDDTILYRFGPRGAELELAPGASVDIRIPNNRPLRMDAANGLAFKAETTPTTSPLVCRMQATLLDAPPYFEV